MVALAVLILVETVVAVLTASTVEVTRAVEVTVGVGNPRQEQPCEISDSAILINSVGIGSFRSSKSRFSFPKYEKMVDVIVRVAVGVAAVAKAVRTCVDVDVLKIAVMVVETMSVTGT